MKIAVLSHTFPKNENDPTAAFLHSFVLGLKNVGNQSVVIIPYVKDLDSTNFPYKVIPYRYIWPSSLHILGYAATLKNGTILPIRAYFIIPFLFLFGVIKLFMVCKREKIDVISAHWLLPNGLIAALVSKMTSIPFVVTLPGSDVYVAGMNKVFKILANFSYRQAKAVIADSPVFLEKMGQLGAHVKNSYVIPYPVNVNKYKPDPVSSINLRNKLGFKSNNIVILGVGRLVEKKGFKYLLECIPDIIKSNDNVRLVIVGDGDLKKELEYMTIKKNIKNYVVFAGSIGREEILSYYNLSDIFVMPSVADKRGNIDDQPVALIEAMSCGLPIIATNFPGISITVQDGTNGFLVPQKNTKAIKSAISKLVSSSELRQKMGQQSRKIAVSKLSIDKIGEKYTRIFKSIAV